MTIDDCQIQTWGSTAFALICNAETNIRNTIMAGGNIADVISSNLQFDNCDLEGFGTVGVRLGPSTSQVTFTNSRFLLTNPNATGFVVSNSNNHGVTLQGSSICLGQAQLMNAGIEFRLDQWSCISSACLDLDKDGFFDDCSGQDHSLQEIIDAARPGESIELPAGHFRIAAPLWLSGSTLRGSAVLSGQPAGGTTLDGRGVHPCIVTKGLDGAAFDDVEIRSLQLRNSPGTAILTINNYWPLWRDIKITDCVGRYPVISSILDRNRFEDLAIEGCSTTATIFSAWWSADFLNCDFLNNASESSIIDCGNISRLEGCRFEGNSTGQRSPVILANPQSLHVASCFFALTGSEDQTAIAWPRTESGTQLLISNTSFTYADQGRTIVQVLGSGPGTLRLENTAFDSCCPIEPMSFADDGTNGRLWYCDDCPGDVTCDARTDAADLGRLLAAFATRQSRYDLDQDGTVGGGDLGVLLSSWGPCD
jgi:hypothetical protein